VVTENADNLALNYLVKNPDHVLIVSSLPSFPDEEGDVIALNFQGSVVDEVKYKDDWHFKLIENAEGVRWKELIQLVFPRTRPTGIVPLPRQDMERRVIKTPSLNNQSE
jgi:hypothetical protein